METQLPKSPLILQTLIKAAQIAPDNDSNVWGDFSHLIALYLRFTRTDRDGALPPASAVGTAYIRVGCKGGTPCFDVITTEQAEAEMANTFKAGMEKGAFADFALGDGRFMPPLEQMLTPEPPEASTVEEDLKGYNSELGAAKARIVELEGLASHGYLRRMNEIREKVRAKLGEWNQAIVQEATTEGVVDILIQHAEKWRKGATGSANHFAEAILVAKLKDAKTRIADLEGQCGTQARSIEQLLTESETAQRDQKGASEALNDRVARCEELGKAISEAHIKTESGEGRGDALLLLEDIVANERAATESLQQLKAEDDKLTAILDQAGSGNTNDQHGIVTRVTALAHCYRATQAKLGEIAEEFGTTGKDVHLRAIIKGKIGALESAKTRGEEAQATLSKLYAMLDASLARLGIEEGSMKNRLTNLFDILNSPHAQVWAEQLVFQMDRNKANGLEVIVELSRKGCAYLVKAHPVPRGTTLTRHSATITTIATPDTP